MELKTYLGITGMSVSAFARHADIIISTVHRAVNRSVLPSPPTMKKITDATDGAVQPQDFYD
jgi:hypothetical protein